jgi:hypothetical protein
MNSFAPLDPALLDQPSPEIAKSPDGHTGYPDAMKAMDTRDALMDCCGDAAVRDFPQGLWIEPKDWADKARDNDKYHTWGMNYLDRFTNQNPTHECTCHSLRANFEAARNRQRGVNYPDGPKKGFRYPESGDVGSVWVSPLSVYAEANPRQWGGANVQQVLEIACRRGMLPETIQPHDYGFKHAMQGTTGQGNNNQASGNWLAMSRFPEGWQETAAWLKPLEVIFPDEWEQAVCLVLHGMLESVGRSGHAIPWAQLQFEGANLVAAAYPDSYDVVRYDSLRTIKSAYRGSFAIASVTAPDDWSKPAGA